MNRQYAAGRLLSIGILLICLLPAAVRAEVVVLAVGEWPPYASQQMQDGGQTTRIVLAAFRAAGLPARVVFAPWKRCEAMVLSGEATATLPYKKTPEREKSFIFSRSIDTGVSRLFCRPRSSGQEYCADDIALDQATVGILASHFYVEQLRGQVKTLFTPETVQQLLEMLERGRLDYAVINERVAKYIIARDYSASRQRFAASKVPLFSVEYGMMLSRENPDALRILSQFHQGLERIAASGELQSLQEETPP